VEVLQCTSDNPRTDRNEVETVFPGILKNVKPYKHRPKDLPKASLNPEKIVTAYTKA
jgi:hypothetical protein